MALVDRRGLIVVVAGGLGGLPSPALAGVTVDTTADGDVADAACSLREATIAANTDPDGGEPTHDVA